MNEITHLAAVASLARLERDIAFNLRLAMTLMAAARFREQERLDFALWQAEAASEEVN